jgi:hypothetical protein
MNRMYKDELALLAAVAMAPRTDRL